MRRRRITLTLAAGGLLAAGFLPMAVAFADDGGLIFEPSNGSFYLDSSGPLPPEVMDSGPISVAAGDEYWDAVVGYDSANPIAYPDALVGYEVDTTIGSFTNDDFIVEGLLPIVPIPTGTLIDIADFGGGYANDWIDVPGTGLGSGVSDLLITPFGDLPLLGTALG
ncbi:MAG TPA: hypothetical protein VMC78_22390 [Mycobacterium sp.]|nr:hypothetical protein [Mycobacterium sp.]